ncbi:hypothetical protein FRC09_004259 [Ceratobasidium sp. 395]|nr:hypothetical protein FRC09_004259 [Ceratobasidium sp. 395]
MDVRPWNQPRLNNSKSIDNPFDLASGVPIGLNWLDIEHEKRPRIKAYTSNPSSGCSSTVHLDAWGDTVLYSAGCTWLDIGKHDRDFQFASGKMGCSVSAKLRGATDNRGKWTVKVAFDRPYARVPKVVTWLQEFELDNDHKWNLKSYVENVTTTGFTLTVKGSSDTWIYKATACWIAHPSNRANITSGRFDSVDVCPASQPRQQHSKTITFDKKFERAPRVYAALNYFDITNGANLRIKALVKDVTAQGLTLSIESWGDTVLNSAGVSYIAIEEY